MLWLCLLIEFVVISLGHETHANDIQARVLPTRMLLEDPRRMVTHLAVLEIALPGLVIRNLLSGLLEQGCLRCELELVPRVLEVKVVASSLLKRSISVVIHKNHMFCFGDHG